MSKSIANAPRCAWRAACKQLGYLQAGSFKPLPRKDTAEYEAIKELQDDLLVEWTANGGSVPAEYQIAPVQKRRIGDNADPPFTPRHELGQRVFIVRSGEHVQVFPRPKNVSCSF
jgi:hypothetical protein